MNQKIAVRVYEKKIVEDPLSPKKSIVPYGGVLTFDCETTADQFQNLKFGSYQYRIENQIQDIGIFYEPAEVTEEERLLLEVASQQKMIKLITREEFVEKLVDYVLYKRAICVGHNLVFDISRLCVGVGYCRGRYNGGFSLKLSKNPIIPRIKTTRINERKVLLRFGKSLTGPNFGGHFLDTQILASAVLDTKRISLNDLAQKLNIPEQKKSVTEHGKITPEYIDYNLQDVRLTYLVFEKLKEKYEGFGLPLPLTKVISGASIGKEFLQQMGVQPFRKQNPDFSSEILGWCMSAFYGGRCEVRMRKTPTKTTVLDFSSMYPSICHNMKLQQLMIATKTEVRKVNAQKMLDEIKLEDLYSPSIWSTFRIICKIKPDGDCLPVRSDYDKKTLNVGINYLTSEESFYYFLPDLIYSKLVTGKAPKIEDAWEFVSIGKQDSLRPIKIFGIDVDPRKQDVIHELVVQRNKLKEINEAQAQGLKILANATSYGIFVELNPEKEPSKLNIFSRKTLSVNGFHEKPGEHFNPVIGGLIVSGSRLLLGMIEVELAKMGKEYYACDTDSMFVPPETAKELQEKFESLSPYQRDIYTHEKGAERGHIYLLKSEATDIWFYGVSSKRYVLFEKTGRKLKILDQEGKRGYKLHGLGYILNPFGKGVDWHKQFWEDGLKLHYHLLSEQDIREKYGNYYCISQLTVSSWDIYKRFRFVNKGKPFREQIKPFNFMLLGFGSQKEIKPLAPFSKNYQEIVHQSFIDYKTGQMLSGIEYFQNLADVFFSYFNHREAKLDGDTGLLQKKRIVSNVIIYIGKEGRDLDTQMAQKSPISIYRSKEELLERFQKMTEKEAGRLHIPRATFYRLKNRIGNLRSKTLIRIEKG